MIDDATKYRKEIEDIESGLSDGSYRGPKPIWRDPDNWQEWCVFIGAEYAIGFFGFILVLASLWHVQIESALIVIVLTAVGLCVYRKKHAKGKKKWEKHRDPVGYAERKKAQGGIKGIKNKVSGGGGRSDSSSGMMGGGELAKPRLPPSVWLHWPGRWSWSNRNDGGVRAGLGPSMSMARGMTQVTRLVN